MTKTHRTLARLTLSPSDARRIIAAAQSVDEGMTGNPAFPSPNPVAGRRITPPSPGWSRSRPRGRRKVKGAAQARDQKRDELVTLMHQVKAYVQKVADADPANAEADHPQRAVRGAKADNSHEEHLRGHPRAGLRHGEARRKGGRIPGVLRVATAPTARHGPRCRATLTAKTTVTGLTVGTGYYFRFRTVTKAGEGDWSALATLVVT